MSIFTGYWGTLDMNTAYAIQDGRADSIVRTAASANGDRSSAIGYWHHTPA
ncbi:MAG TPA: hypothetical protein V6D20_24860 [Candidatus Obscuribacterales bacterium]